MILFKIYFWFFRSDIGFLVLFDLLVWKIIIVNIFKNK